MTITERMQLEANFQRDVRHMLATTSDARLLAIWYRAIRALLKGEASIGK